MAITLDSCRSQELTGRISDTMASAHSLPTPTSWAVANRGPTLADAFREYGVPLRQSTGERQRPVHRRRGRAGRASRSRSPLVTDRDEPGAGAARPRAPAARDRTQRSE